VRVAKRERRKKSIALNRFTVGDTSRKQLQEIIDYVAVFE